MWRGALHITEITGLKNYLLILSLWHFSALVNSENGELLENGERGNYMQKWLNTDVGGNWYYLSSMSHGCDQSALLFSILQRYEEMNKFWWHLISVSSSYLPAQHIVWYIRLVWLRRSHILTELGLVVALPPNRPTGISYKKAEVKYSSHFLQLKSTTV